MNNDLTLIALVAIIVLQFITIFLIAGNRKQPRNPGAVRPEHRRPGAAGSENRVVRASGGDTRHSGDNNKKPGDNRGGRPQQGSRPLQQIPRASQQTQAAASIDPMEKSLRDINLRLKNAEREQENARKKFQEDSTRDGQRGERDRNGGRNDRGHRGPRDFNRDRPPRGDRPDRPERPNRGGFENSGHPAVANHPAAAEPETAPAAAPEAVVNDPVTADDLQHGRKFTAKRRPLPAEDAQQNPAAGNDTPPAVNEAPSNTQEEQGETAANIQYGR